MINIKEIIKDENNVDIISECGKYVNVKLNYLALLKTLKPRMVSKEELIEEIAKAEISLEKIKLVFEITNDEVEEKIEKYLKEK